MDEVSEAELLAAASAGQIAECGTNGNRRPVDAELLRRYCHQLKDQIDPRGLRLRNAVIVGSLDVAGLEIPFPVRLDDCEFDEPLIAEGTHLHGLSLTRCGLPGLLGNGLQVRRDLDLSGSKVTGASWTTVSATNPAAVWLCESSIGGRLLGVDTAIDAEGGRAIHADRIHVGGIVRLSRQFTARGQLRMLGAQLDGSIDLAGALIEVPSGPALDLDHAAIGGSLLLIDDATGRRPVIRGRIAMGSARITAQFLIRNATLEEATPSPLAGSPYALSRIRGTALSAPRLSVGAEMTIEGSSQFLGSVDLSMSELSSLYVGTGSSLHAPGRTALDLTNAELLSTFTVGENVPVEGTIRLSGARIHGNLTLRGAILSAPEGGSLVAAQGVAVDGEVELQNLQAAGGDLGFRAATVGSVITAAGAQLRNPTGYTLSLVQTNVKGSVRLTDGFESTGKVVLNRATIAGRLTCAAGSFDCPAPSQGNQRGHAIEAISATINGGMGLFWKSVSPSLDFTNTTTSFLADDPLNWPSRFIITGFTYDRFEEPRRSTWDHTARCGWLSRQAAYDAGPYEQAARVFRQHGYTAGAEEILIAQRKHARRAMTGRSAPLRRLRDVAYNATVGYGYRPGRVLWLLVLLLVLVTVSLEVPAARQAMRATTSAGVVYSLRGPVADTGTGGTATPSGSAPPSGSPRFDACGDGQVRCFSPVLYAVDTVLPLVSLDQRSTWYPDPHVAGGTFMQWWLNVATLLGWLLSSIFVLSLARIARAT